MYPNQLLVLRELERGDLSLWNPYIGSGVDFSASPHNYVLSPFTWILHYLPKSYFFRAFTVRFLLELWLLGFFGFLAFDTILRSRKWALYSSIALQLGSTSFMAITTFPTSTSLLLATIATFLFCSWQQRRPIANYVLLALTFGLIPLTGQIVYVVHVVAGAMVVMGYHLVFSVEHVRERMRRLLVLGLAAGTAVGMGAIRWLPVVVALRTGSRLDEEVSGGYAAHPFHNHNHVLFHYFAFVPESFGTTLHSSTAVFSVLGHDRSIQEAVAPYLGVISVVFLLWSLIVVRGNRRITVLAILLFALWIYQAGLEPVSAALNVALFPFLHRHAAMYLLPLAACLLAGMVGRHVEENPDCVRGAHLAVTWGLVGIFVLGILGNWLKHFPARQGIFRWFVVVLILSGVVVAILGSWIRRWPVRIRLGGLCAFILAILAAFALALPPEVRWIFLSPHRQHGQFGLRATYLITGIFAVVGAIAGVLLWSRRNRRRMGLSIAGVAFACLLIVVFIPRAGPGPDPTVPESAALALLGTFKCVTLLIFMTVLIVEYRVKRIPPGAFVPMILAVLAADLLSFNKIYVGCATDPFLRKSSLYAPQIPRLLLEQDERSGTVSALLPIEEQHVVPNVRDLNGIGNVLANHDFSSWSASGNCPDLWEFPPPGREHCALSSVPFGTAGMRALRMVNSNPEPANIHQDVSDLGACVGRMILVGCFARSETPQSVRLLITEHPSQGQFSPYHSGSGEWEWLETRMVIGNSPGWIRVHVMVEGAAVADLAMVVVIPRDPPQGLGLDLDQYRVNRPHIALGFAEGEMGTLIPALYGIRLYGGVNSSFPREYVKLLRAVGKHDATLSQGCIMHTHTDDRLLDLLGVRYDLGSNGLIRIRPNALSRFRFYERFQVVPDREATLARLMDPDFHPLDSILLAEDPGLTPAARPDTSRRVEIVEQSAGRVKLVVESKRPGVLFFGDSYAEGWTASVNGTYRHVIRANGQFMAVPVGGGRNEVVLRFLPPWFFRGLRITLVGLGVWGVAFAVWLLQGAISRWRARRSQS